MKNLEMMNRKRMYQVKANCPDDVLLCGKLLGKEVYMEYCLETEGLSKSYRNFKALGGLNMHVPKGSIYGFVGRNGAGKTTLIRIISGLQEPTAGSYTLYGCRSDDGDIGNARRRMGAVVETPSIYLDMTARDNLMQQYRVLGMPSFDGIDELLELVGLSDTGKKKAKNFSLGMRQRLGIAIALCGNPDFLVLDEPVNGLDPQGIIRMRELILKLNHEKKITVLISSHILDELSKLATHYGFIDGGRIVEEISAKELNDKCRRCIKVTVSDIRAFSRVMDKLGLKYVVNDDMTADIYDKISITKLAAALDRENCELISASELEESLESHFIKLIGGGRNE